jgi:hypothetical protein
VSVSFFKTLVSDLGNSKILDIKYRETITNQYKKKQNEKMAKKKTLMTENPKFQHRVNWLKIL